MHLRKTAALALALAAPGAPATYAFNENSGPFAAFGATATASLTVSTKAVALTDPTAYASYEANLNAFMSARDALTTQIKTYIDDAMFNSEPFDATTASSLASQANALTAQMLAMASGS
jgi:hypothetical protein